MKVGIAKKLQTAASFYRVYMPAGALSGEHEFIFWEPEFEQIGATEFKFTAPEVDAVIFHMPRSDVELAVIEQLSNMGIRTICDYDDYTAGIDVGHQAYGNHVERQRMQEECAKRADVVTVSTPSLAKFYRGAKVLRNCIPSSYIEFASVAKQRAVTWSGSLNIHTHDFDVIEKQFRRYVIESNVPFVHLGTGSLKERVPVAKEFGNVPFENYIGTIAHYDTGIVPLRKSVFNSAKSWLKGLEHSAVGAAFVASSTPEYREFSKLGAGLIASSPEQFTRQLKRLENDDFRAEQMGKNLEVARTLVVDNHADKWNDIWFAE